MRKWAVFPARFYLHISQWFFKLLFPTDPSPSRSVPFISFPFHRLSRVPSDEFTTRNLWASGFQLTNTGCLGPCHLGPSVIVYPDGVMYTGVKPEDVAVIIDEHLMFDQPVERLKAPADIWA